MILRRVSETGLRLTLGGILLALLIPTLMLVFQAYQQLERDTYFQYRTAAEELARRIDEQLAAELQVEDRREFSDYGFLVVAGEDFVQRSPLSAFPIDSGIPGARSYFQLDADGRLTTPLVPARQADANLFGVAADELDQRLALQNEIADLLSEPVGEPEPVIHREMKEQDVDAEPLADAFADFSSPAAGGLGTDIATEERLDSQVVLDRLQESSQSKISSTLGRVEDLKLDAPYSSKGGRDLTSKLKRSHPVAELETRDDAPATAMTPVALEAFEGTPQASAPSLSVEVAAKQETQRARRLEQNIAPAERQAVLDAPSTVSLESFTSEVEPFRFAVLDAENFILYRTVWRDQARYIQGLVLARNEFIQATIGTIYSDAAIATLSDLIVAYQGELLQAFNLPRRGYFTSAEDVSGTLLYQARMSAPFNDLELIFSATSLPVSAGSAFVMWTGAAMVVVLFGGFWLMYRLGLQQIHLSRQQQDFVSAVSHELKTPLTSIRMYGEILKAGWASEDKKRTYYDFIFQESERLSRLINNVLQLARLTRNDTELQLRPITVGELADVLRSKIATQLEQAQFELDEAHEDDSATLLADTDAFAQIMINLVDNAIKFSAENDLHHIEIKSQLNHDGSVEFSVRDHGPGIPKDQLRRIFELFYRTERELTRETVGTGIGLALVHELVTAMHGRIKVQNMEPGVEFRMQFPRYDQAPASS